MPSRPPRGHPSAMRSHGPRRQFDPTMRRPMGPRGPARASGPPMRTFPPPGHMFPPRAYPDVRGMRPPFPGQPGAPYFGMPSNARPPAPPFDAQLAGSAPRRPTGRQLLPNPTDNQAGQICPLIQPKLPNGQPTASQSEQQQPAGLDTANKKPGSMAGTALVPELSAQSAAEAEAGAAQLEESDDVVSLFGGSDFGDNENGVNNANANGKTDAEQPLNLDQKQSDQKQAQAINPADSAKGASDPKPPDLRNQLIGQSQPGGGGGLLRRPAEQQSATPRVLLQKPPPQQVPHQASQLNRNGQPPNKRSRTLLQDAPSGAIGSIFRGRGGGGGGGHPGRGGRGRGGRGRGGGGGGNHSEGSGPARTLLPTPGEGNKGPATAASMSRGLVKPLLSDRGDAAEQSGSYLMLPPTAQRPPASGLLQTPALTAGAPPSGPVTLLPPAPATTRAPLLGAPVRTQVLPTPRQVEASADTIRVSLLTSTAGQQAAPASTAAAADFSATAIAAYPSETSAGMALAPPGGSLTDSGASLLGQFGKPRLLQQPVAVKTESEMRLELTEAFKSQQYERGYELLKLARATYPHEFTDLVVYEVVEYCASKKEALEVCVLTARLIGEPNVKLLELLADLAEKNPAQLRALTDELWLVFNNVLTLQPDATAMMAFIRCFSSLKSWTKVWGAVDRFAPMQIIPIEGFIFCLEALVNGNASEFVNLGIGLLSNMDPQNLQQVGLELVERLWLRCALDGSTENVGRIEQIRAIFHLTPAQQSNFLNRIRVKVTELVMGNDFETLCRFFSSVSNLEVLSEYVIDAFHVAEDPQAKFELLSKAITEKYRSRNQAMEAFISQTAVRLLKKSVDRMQWAEALKLLRSLRGLNISLMKAVSPTQLDMSEACIANMAFQIYMRSQCYSTAASMLSADTSPIGIALPAAGEHASSRFQLLHELCTACIAEGTLADAASALNAMMQHPVSRSSELNKVYNEFLAACCEASSDDLKLGVEIIPKAHQSSLVISATVLRMLLCASFKHGMKAQAKEYLMLGTKVGIYPVVSVSCPGPKTIQLQSDLSKEEIHVILTNLFVKLKKYLMESLQSRELDVIQECTIKLTALGVGNRDAKFIEVHKIQSTEQAVLQRASEILQTANNFQSVVSTRFLSENGVSVLKLDGTMVYQCVYYVDEDV